MAKVVEAKIVIPLKSDALGEVANIDKVLVEIEDVLVERLGVAVDVTSEITRKLPRRQKVKTLEPLRASSVVRSVKTSHSE